MTTPLAGRARALTVTAALAAVFLGALDSLVIGAAMPTIVSELGEIELYGWVFSVYMLSRAVSLPLFGKLCDSYSSRKLFVFALGIFLCGSLLAGLVNSMGQLILVRALQGVGAGGNFAVAYVVVAEVSPPADRGRMMGLISFVWGVASVLGPALGGLIVTYLPWPWVFYLNIPVGAAAAFLTWRYFREVRPKRKRGGLDFLGGFALSTGVLSLLFCCLLLGQPGKVPRVQVVGLAAAAVLAAVLFVHAERRASDPVISLAFFKNPGFCRGNGAAFASSFAIFSLVAFLPLFVQGVMTRSAMELGMIMMPLSFSWSAGALTCGQIVRRLGRRRASIGGSILLTAAAGAALSFSAKTPATIFCLVTSMAGLGMGFVSVATLLTVQAALNEQDLGVATSSQQFARTLGGTVGIGVAGAILTARMDAALRPLAASTKKPGANAGDILLAVQRLLHPKLGETIGAHGDQLRSAVAAGIEGVLWLAVAAAAAAVILCLLLPAD